ncbi:Pappalysin-1 [Dirofilaria immitis]
MRKFALHQRKLGFRMCKIVMIGIRFIKILFIDGTYDTFEQLYAHCDQPLTLRLTSQKRVTEVQIRTNNPFVSIDAVQFVSFPSNPLCSHCLPYRYRIYRTPPFPEIFKATTNYHIIDSTIEEGIIYTYTVAVENDEIEGLHSPGTTYSYNMNVCGDGRRSNDEECDDGNLNDGDGCSQNCIVEEKFHCIEENKLSPSFCYIYEGDGECESFERDSHSKDCNNISTSIFHSQYHPTSVYAYSTILQKNCSLRLLSTAPLTTGCNIRSSTWDTCSQLTEAGEISLHASFPNEIFPTSIMIGFETILSTGSKPVLSIIRINLQYVNKTMINLEEQGILSCAQNPLEVAIPYTLVDGLSNVKAVHLHVSNPSQIVITAIILRSVKMFDLLTLQTCAGENKYFDPVAGFCIAKDCRSLNTSLCTPLNIPKSRHECYDTTCTYMCESGFMFENSQKTATVQCLNGHWIGNMNLICQPIHCAIPKIEHADIDCPNGTNYHDRCIFRCRNNAMMIGQINYIVCEENGLWTVPEAFCQVVCPHDGLLTRNISYDSINCKVKRIYDTQTSYPLSTVCRANCRRHYRSSHMQSLHTKIRLVCSDDGIWIGPTCIPITCPSPKIVYIGSYNCTNGFEIGSSCQFQCPGMAQQRYSVCKKNGSWSNRFQCPSPRTTCPSPSSTRDVQFTCPRRLIPGTICAIQCRKKGYDAVLKDIQILPNGENLLLLHTVHNISCTISSTFYPQMNALSCVRSCNKKFMGDGWCDFQNNRGYCNWDGGDCCASTVRGGRVRLMFPSLCTSILCQCIDPFAAENIATSSGIGSSSNTIRERKSIIKRTTRYGQIHSINDPMLYPIMDASPDTFAISLADATFLSQNDLNVDRIQDMNQHQQRDNKPKSISSKNAKDWESIKQSVKNALIVYQQQFNNKNESNLTEINLVTKSGGTMVDSENEESMEIHSSAGVTDFENDRPGSSMSATTSSAFSQSLEGFDSNNVAEMEDAVPSIIDFASQSKLMARIRDNKPNRKFPSCWDDDDDDGILAKDMNDPKEQVLTAAEDGNLESLKNLISNNPLLLSARDVDGYTALHRASYSGHADIVDYLLSIGANPEWVTNDGWTVLHCAATWSMCEVVALLLRHGVNVNSRSNGGLTPLHLAITSNQPEDRVLTTVRYLLEAPGIDAAAVSNSGDSPLRIAGRTSAKITEMLMRYFSKP